MQFKAMRLEIAYFSPDLVKIFFGPIVLLVD